MNKSYRAWYLLAALLALVPAGVRMLVWHRARPQPVDAEMARAGEVLFKHQWQANDPLAAGGDGLGPVFNATSCVACHNQAGPGGAGGLAHNVTTFIVRDERPGVTPREGVLHAHGLGCQETLHDIHPNLPTTFPPPQGQTSVSQVHPARFLLSVHVSQRNTPALFGALLIDAIPERAIVAGEKAQSLKWGMAPSRDEDFPVGRALRLANGRIGRFGWKAQTASLSDFVQAACANELGLGNPGHPQPRPLGKPDWPERGLDLTKEQCDQLTAFVASLPAPVERLPQNPGGAEAAVAGKRLFGTVGCAECHTPNLGSAEGIYSDLLLHSMGQDLVGGGSYGQPPLPQPDGTPGDGPSPSEWRTPPLWGVADSAPYMHDGRAATLNDAIRLHGGQGAGAARRYGELAPEDMLRLIAFLKTLRAP